MRTMRAEVETRRRVDSAVNRPVQGPVAKRACGGNIPGGRNTSQVLRITRLATIPEPRSLCALCALRSRSAAWTGSTGSRVIQLPKNESAAKLYARMDKCQVGSRPSLNQTYSL